MKSCIGNRGPRCFLGMIGLWCLVGCARGPLLIQSRAGSSSFVAGFVVQSTVTKQCQSFPPDSEATPLSPQLTRTHRSASSNSPQDLSIVMQRRKQQFSLRSSSGNGPNKNDDSKGNVFRLISEDPKRSFLFSALMTGCGAGLGPFLDSYHSAFGVLKYNEPIQFTLWGSETYPALTTAWWVPELFGLAGFLIGWLYILLDEVSLNSPETDTRRMPSPPKTLAGISFFTLQYWLSGILVQTNLLDRTGILNLMSLLAAAGFLYFDGTFSGLVVSLATCVGGPLIEAGLISATSKGLMSSGYHYTDLGETGFFPLWIVPVYFLGGPANGNLARGFWNALSKEDNLDLIATRESCKICNGTRRTPCPNCDGVGMYVAMGGRTVQCTSCSGRGYVICRSCFDLYDEDPYDIEGIRETMRRMPD